ncbi:cell cycle protein GpsB [Marinithermofilum abyssi]|uniref:Cell cycle protein GpsB n=1 Tax=Marinithermofilum abyssi TaxID=1571185 RepID=A0A8J2YCD7_9BACL|nr:DivIVA domain-containing protein [Marinithermofilum abyssi]GGE14944.1 cell cycle protein GpsB [Marinithermofilum abyssi]
MQRLTPRDIYNKDFKTSLRGYDIDEVNHFLDLVIKNYEEVIQENQQLKEELRKQKRQRTGPVPAVGDQDQMIRDIVRRLERLEKMVRR